MKVILTTDVKGTGKKGDIINVSEGFARNFLLPKGVAIEASENNIKEIDKKKAFQDKKKAGELDNAKALKQQLEKLKISIPAKTGEGGRLFGAITSKDIGDAIEKNHKISLDKRKIELKTPIKTLGEHAFTIKLYPEVTANMQVTITAAE